MTRQLIPPPSPPRCVAEAASAARQSQHGGVVLPLAVTLLVVAASTLALQAAKQTERPLADQRTTEQRMARIERALRAYVVLHRQLPCPADGTLDTGWANPMPGLGACSPPTGDTVPWATLGLQKYDALDGWNRKISYRVFVGNAALPPSPPGLQVDDGGVRDDLAWVLISHGPTGYGAWLLKGESLLPAKRMPMPSSAAVPPYNEFTNTQSAATIFVKKPFNVVDLPPTDAAFFDDVVRYKTLADLETETGLTFAPPSSNEPIETLLDPTAPQAIDTKGNGSNLTSIDISGGSLGTIRLTSTGGDISTNGPYNALGVCSSGCGTGNDSARALAPGESLSFRLVSPGQTMQGFSLGLLGLSTTPTTVAVSVTFRRNGVVLSTTTLSASVSTTFPSSPQLTSLTPTPVVVFDEVVISPVGTSTRFYVATVGLCAASTTCN
jgi:hypothetical protein